MPTPPPERQQRAKAKGDREGERDRERREHDDGRGAEEEQHDARGKRDRTADVPTRKQVEEADTAEETGQAEQPKRKVLGPEETRKKLVDEAGQRDQMPVMRGQQRSGREVITENEPTELVTPEGEVPSQIEDGHGCDGRREDKPVCRGTLVAPCSRDL